MTTKQEIIRWWHTGILPSDGTVELNQFMLDTCVTYDAFWHMPDGSKVGTVYKNLTKAMKAYKKYGFAEADIAKMHPSHDEIVANNIKLKSVTDHKFRGFRYAVPGHETEVIMR